MRYQTLDPSRFSKRRILASFVQQTVGCVSLRWRGRDGIWTCVKKVVDQFHLIVYGERAFCKVG